MNIEALKHLNLVDFLSLHYGLEFHNSDQGAVCRSPFGADQDPSFFVRRVDGHWLFKDFSSGIGGTIIDFVQRIEGLADFSGVVSRIEQLVGSTFSQGTESQPAVPAKQEDDRGYDLAALYSRFRREDSVPCRSYLIGRGIKPELVDELIADGDVVYNRYQGRSWCCFAIRDRHGMLQCLDNHEIGGSGKFVLGKKSVFSRDWSLLAEAPVIFVCEGIIDYLSIKTLEKGLVGFALLGNQLRFDEDLLTGCERIISALDEDRGGSSALFDLMEQYPDKEITAYDLKGHKDPNELLQTMAKRRLTAEDKLKLYEAFQQADNKAELARQWGIDRSHMYQIVKDCQQMLLSSLQDRSPGRRPVGQPETMRDACQQIKDLQEDNNRLAIERDTLSCREELLGIRLKWAQIEAAELRGDPVDDTGPKKKTHIKKKKRERRLRR